MPYKVPVSFDEFLSNIEPPAYQKSIAVARRDRLISLLEDRFSILDAFPSGSLPRYTAVTGHADLDVIVVLHYGKHIKGKKPSEVLLAVRDWLDEKYNVTIRRNGQAVTLYYKTWPNVDVVPVSRTVNSDDSVNHYNVPDMHREVWLDSRPRKHSSALTERNSTFGPQFKRLIKMLKWWNHQHSTLLQSFHIEVMALRLLTGTFDEYPWQLTYFFKRALELMESSLWYEDERVDGYLDWSAKQEVIKRIQTAYGMASTAWYCTYGENNDHRKAIGIWRQMFGEKFPSYG